MLAVTETCVSRKPEPHNTTTYVTGFTGEREASEVCARDMSMPPVPPLTQQ